MIWVEGVMGQSRLWNGLIGGLLALIGLVLLVGGARLMVLGGSPYYLVAGLACLVSGVLILKRRAGGVTLYAAFLAATLAWAIGEVGMSFWDLLPRLAGPAALAVLIGLPFVRKRIVGPAGGAARWSAMAAGVACLVVLGVAYGRSQPSLPDHDLASAFTPSTVQDGAADEWTAYGRTHAGTRYSPDDQITPQNVAELEPAWTYRNGFSVTSRPDVKVGITFMATPLMVEGRLYVCTPDSRVIALDPDSGKQIWLFDPKADIGDAQMLNCRGVSYHRDSAAKGLCASRIIGTAIDGRLFTLDAATGQLCPGFGNKGFVSLKERMGKVTQMANYVSSPPVIVGNTAILGGYIRDNWTVDEPSGVIRAYDVKSGKLVWDWDSGRPEGAGPLAANATYTRSSPNSWTVLSADPALGLVYVPMGNATPDHVGMHRTAVENKYASSLVALDAATGKVRWHYQTTHHDLWDYDIPAQPVLFDMPMANGSAPAVAAVTKRGEIFILDRRTGKPLTAVKERPAPKGDIPGEQYAPTQPYSVGFPSFNPPKLTEAKMWGATPIDQMICRIRFRSYRYDGDFTPPSTGGSIQFPGLFGVLNWGSVSIDEGRGVMMVNSSAIAQVVRLYPRDKQGEAGPAAANSHVAGMLAQEGTPYALSTDPLLSPLGIPCHGPPWGFLSAVDLKTRKMIWQRPLGTSEDIAPMGVKVPGIFNIGGTVSTKSGVVFIGATLDDYLRAFDIRSGKELWKGRLPAGGQATPMTYVSPKTGRQYVVIAAGGHRFLGSTPGDHLVAFALPQKK
jgi:quinoprotein glucose dehydrogenase/quinate dehydrogenase (quinone)